MHPLAETLLDEPVIAAVKTDEALTAALASPCSAVFLLASTLLTVDGLVHRIHDAGKLAVVHIDLVDGLSSREIAVDSLNALCHPDGIISTRPTLIRRARHRGLLTVQRAFILDSLSLTSLSGQLEQGKPDFVEILPGIMPRVIAEISARTQVPVIVLRDASLEEHDVTLVFRFAENEYFKPGYTGLTERTLHIADRLLEPGNWSQQYFGTYGPVKHQLMIDWTGEVWDDSYIRSLLNGDSGYLSYLKEFFQQKLEEENAKRQEAGLDIYREADGSEIRF